MVKLFCILSTVNRHEPAMNIGVHMNFQISIFIFFPNICPGVEFLDHMATLFLIFKGTPILFSIVAAPIYIPTNRAGFPDGSDGKESACNVRYPDLNSKSERSPGEGNGNPLQYS